MTLDLKDVAQHHEPVVPPAGLRGMKNGELDEVWFYLTKYYEQLKKREFVHSLKEDTVRGVASVVLITSYASNEEIAALKGTPAFEEALKLCEASVVARRALPELRDFAKRQIWEFMFKLARQRRLIEDQALGRELQNIRKCAKTSPSDALRIRRRVVGMALNKKANADLATNHRILTTVLQNASMFLEEMLGNDYAFEILVDGRNIAEHLACALVCPQNGHWSLREIEPAWKDFPLKWHLPHLPMDEARALFAAHKAGADLGQYFVSRYEAGGLRTILTQSEHVHNIRLLRARRNAIYEAARAYEANMFRATICLALTIIEGLVWDFATLLHAKHGDMSPSPKEAFRIRDILGTRRMKAELDIHFIHYFCHELYPARNPVLHGRVRNVGCGHDAAMKLATVEYLIERIGNWMVNDALDKLDKSTGPERAGIDRLMRRLSEQEPEKVSD